MSPWADHGIAELAKELLETPRHPQAWTTSINSLARLLGAADGFVWLYDPSISSETIELTTRHCGDCPRTLEEYAMLLPDGEPRVLGATCPRGCTLLAGLHRSGARRSVLLAVRRPGLDTPFGPVDRDRFALLLPAVVRAAELTLQELKSDIGVPALQELYQRSSNALVLLRAGGEVVATNRAAEAILARDDGLRASHGVLEAAHVEDTHALHEALQQCRTGPDTSGFLHGRRLMVRRRSGRRPLVVAVFPFGHHLERAGFSGVAAALAITDPESPTQCSDQALQELFGLTEAESRVAVLLMGGATVTEAAQELGISLLTARSHLKHIFAKTGTHRQVDLVQLLMRTPEQTLLPRP